MGITSALSVLDPNSEINVPQGKWFLLVFLTLEMEFISKQMGQALEQWFLYSPTIHFNDMSLELHLEIPLKTNALFNVCEQRPN